MLHRLRLLPALLAVALMLTACGGGSKSPSFGVVDWPAGTSGDVGPEIGQRAPNFKLETSTAGAPLELATTLAAGRPVLVNFWASWCANCVEEMATLDAANAGGLPVLGINLRENEEKVNGVASEAGATFPLGMDRKGQVARAYRVTNLPATVVIGADGIIREVIRGPIDQEKVDELKASLIGGGA